jgi:hypothetical protein
MTNKEKIRLNLDISPQANKNLTDLKNRTESTSVAEVIRRAIALYDLVTTHMEKDGSIILKHKDGEQEVLRLL